MPVDIQAFVEAGRDRLPGLLGVEIVEIEEGHVRMRLPLRPELLAPNGYLHAGTVVALADSACGYGCIASLPEGAAGFTTVELKTNFLATALDGTLQAESRRVHGGRTLRDCLERKSAGVREEILVVTPALNSPLKHWVSDNDAARADAQARLDASLERLRNEGIEARGQIGDGDPLQAIEDALRTFGADEIVISTHPEGRSNWLERGVVQKARERFPVPVTHVVVDLAAEHEQVRG